MNARTRFASSTYQFSRIAAITAALLASNVASAANVTWQGTNNGLWTTGTNWNPNTAPTTNSSVFFGATGGQTSRVNQSLSLTDLNFDAAVRSYTINSASSAVLTVNNVSNNSNFNQQFSVATTLAGGTIGGSGNIGFSSVSGTANVLKSGTGQVTISTGPFSGTLTVGDGALFVTGDIGSANVVVNSGASLSTTANNPTTFNNIDVQGGLFSPGGTPGLGSVVVNESLTLGAGSVSDFNIVSTDNDNVISTDLNYDGGLNITFSDTTSVVFNWFIPTGIPAAPSNTSWNLFTSTNTPTGTFDSVGLTIGSTNYSFTSLGNGLWRTVGDIGLGSDPVTGYYGFLFAEQDATFTSDNGQVNLTAGTVYAVPEPSTIVFAGIGIAMFGWSSWTRRRAQARRKMIEASIA